MVFHTAPPQPASKARITWPPVLVGGPDASQNGFGLVTPANFTLRSAIVNLRIGRKPSRRDFARMGHTMPRIGAGHPPTADCAPTKPKAVRLLARRTEPGVEAAG